MHSLSLTIKIQNLSCNIVKKEMQSIFTIVNMVLWTAISSKLTFFQVFNDAFNIINQEFDSAANLLKNRDGYFYSLVQETGPIVAAQLTRLANQNVSFL